MKNNPIMAIIRRNKIHFALAIFSGITSSACTVILSLGIGKFYEIYFHDTGNKSRIMHLLGLSVDDNLTAFFIFYGSLVLAKGIAEWAMYFFSKASADKLTRSLRDQLFIKLLRATPEAFNSKAPGKYLLRFSGDLQAIQDFLTRGIILFLKDIVFLLLGCWFLLKVDYTLALVVFVYIPVLPLINYFFSSRIKKRISEKRSQKSSLLAFVSERFFSMEALKMFRKERIEIKRFKKRSAKLYTVSIQYHRSYAYIQAVTSILLYALPALLLLIVAIQHIAVSKNHLMAFLLLTFMQLPALKRIGKIQTTWQAGVMSLNKITGLLKYAGETNAIRKEMIPFLSLQLSPAVNKHNIIFSTIEKGRINFINYPDADLLIKKLTGIIPDNNNEILLNNVPISCYSAAELRSITSIVSSPADLYGSTIFDAAVHGRNKKRKEQFTETLLQLGFTSTENNDIADIRLSKINFQQKKIVCIARAVLANTQLLVLDNPFETLDEKTKNKCFMFLNSLVPQKTIIIVNNTAAGESLIPILKQGVN